MRQGVDRCINHRLDNRIKRGRHLVVHPDALASHVDESRPAQIREMPRDGRLGEAEGVMEVAHTDFVVAQ